AGGEEIGKLDAAALGDLDQVVEAAEHADGAPELGPAQAADLGGLAGLGVEGGWIADDERGIFQAQFGEGVAEDLLVEDVAGGLAFGDLVEGRQRDIDPAALDEFLHL